MPEQQSKTLWALTVGFAAGAAILLLWLALLPSARSANACDATFWGGLRPTILVVAAALSGALVGFLIAQQRPIAGVASFVAVAAFLFGGVLVHRGLNDLAESCRHLDNPPHSGSSLAGPIQDPAVHQGLQTIGQALEAATQQPRPQTSRRNPSGDEGAVNKVKQALGSLTGKTKPTTPPVDTTQVSDMVPPPNSRTPDMQGPPINNPPPTGGSEKPPQPQGGDKTAEKLLGAAALAACLALSDNPMICVALGKLLGLKLFPGGSNGEVQYDDVTGPASLLPAYVSDPVQAINAAKQALNQQCDKAEPTEQQTCRDSAAKFLDGINSKDFWNQLGDQLLKSGKDALPQLDPCSVQTGNALGQRAIGVYCCVKKNTARLPEMCNAADDTQRMRISRDIVDSCANDLQLKGNSSDVRALLELACHQ